MRVTINRLSDRSCAIAAPPRPFAVTGSQATWLTAKGHIVRPRGAGGLPD